MYAPFFYEKFFLKRLQKFEIKNSVNIPFPHEVKILYSQELVRNRMQREFERREPIALVSETTSISQSHKFTQAIGYIVYIQIQITFPKRIDIG